MKVIAFCTILFCLLSIGSGLKCFVCNSFIDPACSDEFLAESNALQTAFLQECNTTSTENVILEDSTSVGNTTSAEIVTEESTPPFCRKMVMNIERASGTIERIQRDCAYERRELNEGYFCYQKRSEDYTVDVCQCDGDMCNHANNLTFASILAVLVPVFTRFL